MTSASNTLYFVGAWRSHQSSWQCWGMQVMHASLPYRSDSNNNHQFKHPLTSFVFQGHSMHAVTVEIIQQEVSTCAFLDHSTNDQPPSVEHSLSNFHLLSWCCVPPTASLSWPLWHSHWFVCLCCNPLCLRYTLLLCWLLSSSAISGLRLQGPTLSSFSPPGPQHCLVHKTQSMWTRNALLPTRLIIVRYS